MLHEMISQDVKTELYQLEEVSESSSREEISVREILERRVLGVREKSFEKPFFDIQYLLQMISQIDYSSSRLPLSLEFKSETALTEEFFRKVEQIKVLEKMSRICDKIILEESSFRGVDKTKLLRTISEILNEIPSEQLNIREEELFERIRGVLALEVVSGILNELTPEHIKDFDEAVKRRPLFK